jgi:hypothetical protein
MEVHEYDSSALKPHASMSRAGQALVSCVCAPVLMRMLLEFSAAMPSLRLFAIENLKEYAAKLRPLDLYGEVDSSKTLSELYQVSDALLCLSCARRVCLSFFFGFGTGGSEHRARRGNRRGTRSI